MQIIKSIAFLRKLICKWSIFRRSSPCLEVQMLNDESFFRLPEGPGNLVGLLGAVRRTYLENHDAEKVRSCQGVS